MKNIIEFATKLSGHVSLKVVRADGSVKAKYSFANLVTDSGLDSIGTQSISNATDYLAVGTGTTPPVNGDVGLQTEVSRTITLSGGSSYTTSGASPWWNGYVRTWVFNPGTFSGQTLTELGLFDGAAPGTMFSRALIKDGAGTPTSIVVLADEYLYVTWEIRKHVGDEGDTLGTINISGTVYDYTIRATNVDSYANSLFWWSGAQAPYGTGVYAWEDNTLQPITDQPIGSGDGDDSRSVAAYGPGNYYRDTTGVFNPASANFPTGIGAVQLCASTNAPTYGGWVIYFHVTKLPKDADKELTLTFRSSWGRYIP